MSAVRSLVLAGSWWLVAGSWLSASGYQLPAPPERTYFVLVASESVDRVAVVQFGPDGARVTRDRYVGTIPTELAGPHGLGVAPDGASYFVSTAHGTPYGRLTRYTTDGDAQKGAVVLGSFPASLQVAPNGHYVYVANFNLHGEMVTSSVSVVAAEEMVEVARIPTCTMPHGSRFTPDGARHYSTCMMDEALVEIDTRKLAVSRWFFLTGGKEMGMAGAPPARGPANAAAHDMGGHGMEPPKPGDITCSPTWAQPAPDGSRVWVACNRSSEIVEVDAKSWRVTRRIAAGPGVYNIGVTHDGKRIIATNKRGASVSVFDAASGRELGRIPTTRTVVHGVAVSDDDRYAFISIEGSGAQPGTVDVIDLQSLTKVASVNVGQQAGGIDFWKSEAVK